MKIVFLSMFDEATGNTTTALRIQKHLEDAGHTIEQLPVDRTPLDTALSGDAAIGIHAYGSGKFLHKSTLPFIIIFGGTDLNVCVEDHHHMEVMTGAVHKAKALVAFNHDFLSRAEELWPECAEKLHCIPQAVQTEPSVYSLRAKLDMKKDDVLFLLPAGLRDVKDPLFLVEEVMQWHEKDPRIHLVIVGATREAAYTEKVHQAAKQNEGIICAGMLEQPDLFAAMWEADAVLNTSKSECSPNSILEAMQIGTPVIARDIPGNAAIVRHDDTGLLFETPNSFRTQAEAMLRNTELRDTLVRNAMRYVEAHHSLSSERKAYQHLFSSIL